MGRALHYYSRVQFSKNDFKQQDVLQGVRPTGGSWRFQAKPSGRLPQHRSCQYPLHVRLGGMGSHVAD